ncbi:MAG: ATPase P [Dorea sp.]|nr:ATPase P [Dorea sp.]
MLFAKPLSNTIIDEETLKKDKKSCRKFGPCGVGSEAFYLNSFYIDRSYYVPIRSVTRIFKRVAMSKGGFTGKGIFATLPYLVVIYDGGKEKQCLFKHEEHVDQMLDYVREHFPDIKLVSEKMEIKMKERAKKEAARTYPEMSQEAKRSYHKLKRAKVYLDKKPILSESLTRCAKAKRVNDRSNPAYRYVALAIVLMALVAAIYGVYAVITHAGMGLYFLLFGLAGIFLFSSAHVLPTRENNKAYIQKQWDDAVAEMEKYLSHYDKCACCDKASSCKKKKDAANKVSTFPVPARYAHPALLDRMMISIKEGRAETVEAAYNLAKQDLKAMNSSVTVDQEVYDQIMAIKPMFLVEDYR